MGFKSLWNTALDKLGILKKGSPIEVARIVAIQGEFTPGLLTVDLAIFNQLGEPIPYPTKTIKAQILPRLRATANRILCGLDTPEDEAVIELYVLNIKEVKDYQVNHR